MSIEGLACGDPARGEAACPDPDPARSAPEGRSGAARLGDAAKIARRANLARLRARIAEIERRPPVLSATMREAAPAADDPRAYWGEAFGASRVLHEVRFAGEAPDESDHRSAAAALGFALALAGQSREPSPLVLIDKAHEATGDGAIYPPGLCALGVDPDAVLFVRARSDREALWAAEEALKVATEDGVRFSVILFLRRAGRGVDLSATRRLHLAAEAGGSRCILVRGAGGVSPASCAPYRWRAGPAPSHPMADDPRGPGVPAWRVALDKGGEARVPVILECAAGGLRVRQACLAPGAGRLSSGRAGEAVGIAARVVSAST